jgi:lipopolysaccharide biosynthesis regulator YciM
MTDKYLKQISEEFPNIREHQEDDLEWWNEGLDFLHCGKIVEAEKKFKMLTLSQPQHYDGYRGLAWVYEKSKDFSKAKEAIFERRCLKQK